tara:strand:+ start:1699 stop:1878 length:180 start_codon:yes stop_codon:yes gene_type:complete
MNDNNDEINFQIRKFLKQVGVGSHQIIEKELINKSNFEVSLSLEINNKEIKKFKTTIQK